jgi:hypothetical protein
MLQLMQEWMTRPCLWDPSDFERNLINNSNFAWKETSEAVKRDPLE